MEPGSRQAPGTVELVQDRSPPDARVRSQRTRYVIYFEERA